MTLYTALETLAKLTAPFTPFLAEQIYQNIVRTVDETAPESVHLCDFPVCDESFIDAELERRMDDILRVVTLGRAARSLANIKNRQPLSEMFVQGVDELPEMYMIPMPCVSWCGVNTMSSGANRCVHLGIMAAVWTMEDLTLTPSPTLLPPIAAAMPTATSCWP